MVKNKVDIDLINVLNERIIKGWSKDIDRKISKATTSSKISAMLTGIKQSPETKNLLSLIRKGKASTERQLAVLKNNHKNNQGKRLSEAHISKISASNKGKVLTPGQLAYIESRKNKPLSDSHKAKISNALTGKKASFETRKKISLLHKGKKVSDETKLKMSESIKAKFATEEYKLKLKLAWEKRKLNKLSLKEKPNDFN